MEGRLVVRSRGWGGVVSCEGADGSVILYIYGCLSSFLTLCGHRFAIEWLSDAIMPLLLRNVCSIFPCLILQNFGCPRSGS